MHGKNSANRGLSKGSSWNQSIKMLTLGIHHVTAHICFVVKSVTSLSDLLICSDEHYHDSQDLREFR